MLRRILDSLLTLLLNFIDLLCYYALRIFKGKSFMCHDLRYVGTDTFKVKGVEIPDPNRKPDESNIWRNVNWKNKLVDTFVPNTYTLDKIFDHYTEQFKDNRCMGVRPILDMKTETKIMPDGSEVHMHIPYFGEIRWEKYSEIRQRVIHVGSGIVQFTGLNSKDKFAIFEDTCQEWMLTAQACFRYNIAVVTVYATLGEEALITALNESEVTAILLNESQLSKFERIAPQIPTLKYIIYRPSFKKQGTSAHDYSVFKSKLGIQLMSFVEVERLGASAAKHPAVREVPNKDSTALIMYTSGTTGKPKGVILTHFNIVSTMCGVLDSLGDDPTFQYVYIAYLPLAHVLELVAENFVYLKGGCVGYGSPKTLTDRGAKPCGDLVAIKPSVMAGVPKVFDTIKKSAFEKINQAPGITKWLFNKAFEAKKSAIKEGRETPFWNALVFKKAKAITGGNLKLILSGGAPLNADSQTFLRVVLGCITIQGYGLTETSAGTCVQGGYHEFTTKRVGPPVGVCEVKLLDVPEMNYRHTDKPLPRGEVLIRGNSVSKGYYKNPSQTAEAFREDGFFCTGDVGCIHPDGTIEIIDRRKNLVKLSIGEYVALEKLESVYGNSPFVSPNGICVYADPLREYCVALVLPQQTFVENWAKDNGVNEDFVQLCKNSKVKNAILENLKAEAKKSKFASYEIVRDIRLLPDEWTPENGMLTAAQKLKRSEIKNQYLPLIEEMYS